MAEHPSTWQLLFGKNRRHDGSEDNQRHAAEEAPPQVADQLLAALRSTHGGPEDDGDEADGRECSAQLLGKRNAFVPELREAVGDDAGHAVRHQAREILQARLAVERRAEELKRPATRPQPAKAAVAKPKTTAERLQRLREIQQRRDEQQRRLEQEEEQRRKRKHELMQRGAREVKATSAPAPRVVRKTPLASNQQEPHATHRTRAPAAAIATPSNQPPDQHEAKQTKQTRDREATKQTSKTAHQQQPQDPRRDETRELRALDDKLRRLHEETNAAVDAERQRAITQRVTQIKRRVWALWRDCVDRRRRHEASVTRAYEWRQLQRLWNAWRRVAREAATRRAAEAARLALVQEKQQCEAAELHCRRRTLPVWFLRWRAAARASRESRTLEADMQRRREHAQRLVEKLARDKAEGEEKQQQQQLQESPPPSHASKPRHAAGAKTVRKPVATQPPSTRSRPIETAAPLLLPPAPPREEPSASVVAPPPDAFYVSMQERATQRKARREQLQAKYAAQEQEKRELLARQVAEREAQLEQQKREEKEARRARQRAAADEARRLALQREATAIQCESADLHNRLRLLFHHGWRPWKQHWMLRKRTERHAGQWHGLRLQHRAWLAWTAFVAARRQRREQEQREKLQWAADHDSRRTLRGAVSTWRAAVEKTRKKELALRRHVQWSALSGVWRVWRRELMLEMDRQRRRVQGARDTMDGRQLKRVLAAWRTAAVDSAVDRQRLQEKERLWQKARMWLDE